MRILLSLTFIACTSFASFSQVNTTATNPTAKAEVSKKKAVILAKKTINGKTLKISEQTDFYTVRILKSDGHVVDLHINKKTGEVKKD
ncbi:MULTISPECIES: PepSY domain-containing protein [Pseudoalteromonas]|uniref:PepSY domain-containing protein n=1 Tax=Pseudoalteromonas fuliginea TaxID=1872678 RepID=A0ABD3YDJ1_9GAMM|nr:MULTISPECIES: PepSY domain-containing protein [Pseudoalteromonas]ALQ08397.1 hypothetical protein D172_010200 [Pseudoalteromonas sp. Bsw20308]ATG77360.1 hypothetical protein AOR04_07345 [Pseudoalteromonas sp. 1_2015MBL_MicDiv]KAA1155933.1 hypothetical protein EU509_10680 [Pseudoalteromonas fuliginea]KAA1167172.1 hypothetical protein EUZ79_10670 [Pseudoalteromonas fuliginea]KDC53258.1 hypothetical protein DC53_01790 [Pseudoalteromonas fuliginea]